MLRVSPVHPEGPRYAASLVFLPGLWVGSEIWRSAASYFGHRGWQGYLIDTRSVGGGIATRAHAVAAHLRSLESPPILLGIDAGAVVALAAAHTSTVRALVLLSPLVPGSPTTHAVTWSWRLVWGLLRGRAVRPPSGRLAELVLGELSGHALGDRGDEDARLLADLARRAGTIRRSSAPTLVLRGTADPLLGREDARTFADATGADLEDLASAGHWPIVGPAWPRCVETVHRWLVRRLGEPLLDLHAESMADRGDESDAE